MTTLREIVNKAFRVSNIVDVGETPEQDEFSEGLFHLKSFIRSLFGYEAGEGLTDISLATGLYRNTFTPSNTRLILDSADIVTVNLDPLPRDGARFAVLKRDPDLDATVHTLDGNGRTIDGDVTSTVAADQYTVKEWFYRADKGDWVEVTELDENSQSPFPSEFDDFLILSLAMRLNPSYGQATTQEHMDLLRRQRSKFRARYKQSKHVNSELALTTRQYWASDEDFNTGQVT